MARRLLSVDSTMQNPSPARPDSDSPFFSLLSEADHVQIREIPTDNRDRMVHSLERTLKDFEGDQTVAQEPTQLRTFFVHIRMPAPKPTDTSAQHEREYLIGSAQVLLDNSEYVLARNIFSYLLKDQANDAGALRGLGICFFRLGEILSAKKCFTALCELPVTQGPGESWFWLGQCHLADGNDDEAARCFANTGELDNQLRFELYKNWGNCLTRLGKNDEAAIRYEEALRLNPASDILLVNLGTLSLQKQDHRAAEGWFRRALALNAQSSKAHCGLGLVALSFNQAHAAHDLLQAALDLDSQNIVALHQLVLLSQGPLPQAVIKPRLLQFLTREPRNAEVHYALAVVLYKEGAWKDCESHVDQTLAFEPTHARAQELKAELAKLKR